MDFNTQQDTLIQYTHATQDNQDNTSSFTISSDDALLLYSTNPESLQTYERLTRYPDNDPSGAFNEALKAAQKYEDEPLFAYHLEMAAKQTGNYDLANQIAEDNYKKFPFYLLIRCSYGRRCLEKNKLTEAGSAVAYSFDFETLYPNKSSFHILEFLVFYTFLIEYFCDLQDFHRSIRYLSALAHINKDFPGVSEMRTTIVTSILKQHLSYEDITLLFGFDKDDVKE